MPKEWVKKIADVEMVSGPLDGERMQLLDLMPNGEAPVTFTECSICGGKEHSPEVIVQWVDGSRAAEVWCEGCFLAILLAAHQCLTFDFGDPPAR